MMAVIVMVVIVIMVVIFAMGVVMPIMVVMVTHECLASLAACPSQIAGMFWSSRKANKARFPMGRASAVRPVTRARAPTSAS